MVENIRREIVMRDMKNLYDSLISICSKSDKFHANPVNYRGKRFMIFGYSFTIPNDFGIDENGDALETRGSVFEVDENDEFVSVAALPFEKFFNLHEFEYGDSQDLSRAYLNRYGIFASSDSLLEYINSEKENNNFYPMVKRDGSIISFFKIDNTMDCKSNSSLTSDYKYEALSIVENNKELYDKIWEYVKDDYTVNTEYTSKRLTRQIVVPYYQDEIVVLGVRSNVDGSYVSYEDILSHFGEKYTVGIISDFNDDIYNREHIEGAVVQVGNLRVKFKTLWYINAHHAKDSLYIPSQIWSNFINEDIDDVLAMVPFEQQEYLSSVIDRCNNLYTEIVKTGKEFYETNKHLDNKDYFIELNKEKKNRNIVGNMGLVLSSNLKNFNEEDALENLKSHLLKRKYITKLGITQWDI